MSVLPLSGMRIVECASYVAGPWAGSTLSRLGADVIRVDPIGGAPDRQRWPLAPSGASLYWAGLNQGKRSVVLDLYTEEGRELLRRLVCAPGADAGVLLHNKGERSWLDDATLRNRRPDLIHLMIEGRRNGEDALDYTVNATTGIPYMTGAEDQNGVVNHVLPAWDLITAATASTALTAAIYSRRRTGAGSYIRLALEDVALGAVADLGWLTEALQRGGGRERHGGYIYGSYGDVLTTLDARHVFVAAMTVRQWHALQAATNTTAVFAAFAGAFGTDLSVESARYRYRGLISGVLGAWFAERTLAEAESALRAAGALFGSYQSMAELAGRLARDADRQGAGPVRVTTHPAMDPTLAAGASWRWSDVDAGPRPAPELGADTVDVLSTVLGLDEAEIEDLTRRNVVSHTAAIAAPCLESPGRV